MKNKTQHTPTPWTQYIVSRQFHVGISTVGGNPIALVQNQEKYSEANANAEFIVRAVNSHEALLEAVKDLRYAFYVENSSKKLKEAFAKHAEVLKGIITAEEGAK